ncbi:hypothetical protein LF95_13900 [Thalassospira sp. TSL5-1]|nr:hypothetical protein LF95_13900 [Thalassospira sp. TSL5-1]
MVIAPHRNEKHPDHIGLKINRPTTGILPDHPSKGHAALCRSSLSRASSESRHAKRTKAEPFRDTVGNDPLRGRIIAQATPIPD